MLAAKHASALKAASANETGDGDIEVVGIVPAQGSKFLTNPQSDRTQINFLNKLNRDLYCLFLNPFQLNIVYLL